MNKNELTSEDRIRKGIELILTRKKEDEILFLHSGEGLKLFHLRYAPSQERTHIIWLMFKRTPEIKPYYPAIKTWCASKGLSWKDKTHHDERYISIALDTDIDETTEIINSANEAIFKVKTIYAGSKSTDLSFAIKDLRHPYLFAFFGLTFVVSIGLLPLYELFRLPFLGKPSLRALDWPELFLLAGLLICICSIRYLKGKRKGEKTHTKKKEIFARLALALVVACAFFTY